MWLFYLKKLYNIDRRVIPATDLQGLFPSYPASSCSEILNNTKNVHSGHYWLHSGNGSAVLAYCDMTLTCKGVAGGWMQVANLDMTNTSHQCPPGTRYRSDLPKRLCGNNSEEPGCSSMIFDVHGIEYGQVCGKIIGYQVETPDAFGDHNQPTPSHSIDTNYVDGISLTHGSNPRKHIWTFAAALDEVSSHPPSNCPCTDTRRAAFASQPPSYVGNDYFCDTASENQYEHRLYSEDPLWDGAGCGATNTCCSFNSPPWFLKNLSSPTTEDIEMRICKDEGIDREDTPVEIVELYVQ